MTALPDAGRAAYGTGLALALGGSALAAVLMLSGGVPAGLQRPEGTLQQLGYLFTGTVFLAAALVWGRLGRSRRALAGLAPEARAAAVRRACLGAALLCQAGALCGLAYWSLVGAHAGRHAWGFVATTPLLYLALVPRPARWIQAAHS